MSPRHWKRRWPNGVVSSARSVPPAGAAGPGGLESRLGVDRAVAVDAGDLDGGARLAVELAVAVAVLLEVAVEQCIPFSRWMSLRWTAFLKRSGSSAATTLFSASSRWPLRSFLKTLRKTQPWPWKSANCVRVSLGFRSRHVVEELRVRPQPAQRRVLGVGPLDLDHLLGRELALLGRVHQLAVGLVVPPHGAEVAVHHGGAGVDVADHALARRDRVRELVLDRMARLVLAGSSDRRWPSSRGCRTARTGPSAPASGRWRRPRGSRCSRWSGSRRGGRWCRGARAWGRTGASSGGSATPGSVRFSVPRPRWLSRLAGRPGGSSSVGMPISSGRCWPRSKMRRTLPGWLISKRGSGSSQGSTPFFTVSSTVGGGSVSTRWGVPSGP